MTGTGAAKMLKQFNGKSYDGRHGGPFDRGSADSYYGRGVHPHYYVGPTYQSDEVTEESMTAEEIEAYLAGYEYNEEFGGRKEW
jgi:hypothetical protein